jgi:hypothetical protein
MMIEILSLQEILPGQVGYTKDEGGQVLAFVPKGDGLITYKTVNKKNLFTKYIDDPQYFYQYGMAEIDRFVNNELDPRLNAKPATTFMFHLKFQIGSFDYEVYQVGEKFNTFDLDLDKIVEYWNRVTWSNLRYPRYSKTLIPGE